MLSYLDESYGDNNLIIGCLFIPTRSERKYIHQGLKKIKLDFGYLSKDGSLKEIKYSKLENPNKLQIAKEAINLFKSTYDSFFRAAVVSYSKSDLNKMFRQSKKSVPDKIKRAVIYTKSVEYLIKQNYSKRGITKGILLMDNITRCDGDEFNKLIDCKLVKSTPPLIKHFSYVNSSRESNHTIQICDLLTGAIRNSISMPIKNTYKNQFTKYVKDSLAIPTYDISFWTSLKQGEAESKFPKFTIRKFGLPFS